MRKLRYEIDSGHWSDTAYFKREAVAKAMKRAMQGYGGRMFDKVSATWWYWEAGDKKLRLGRHRKGTI